ncbi:hypothetical protein [Nocardia nepalensis]|uniref:hypothetical protein n=1 Tax=Nocardia nepalensis TaxID=3375448 RepID=UPI003B673B55
MAIGRIQCHREGALPAAGETSPGAVACRVGILQGLKLVCDDAAARPDSCCPGQRVDVDNSPEDAAGPA